jgi:D-glycero-alpha-D-manno-heptose-7-phosphate kinase
MTMDTPIRECLKKRHVEASAPCRIDMGGTLDLSTFYLPLRRYRPCTFNIALDMRTRVSLKPGPKGLTRIHSRGFESTAFPLSQAPYDHPLGLMFAIANYFNADGVEISIVSSSPPRSALGGSSSAAVALAAAFQTVLSSAGGEETPIQETALLAHSLEGSVAGVPCGIQDHLAAAYGGIHAWYWGREGTDRVFKMVTIAEPERFAEMESHILVAYCGVPHVSKDVNGQWVRQFIAGKYRQKWEEICTITQTFVDAMMDLNYKKAARCMNREVLLRREMTPEVFDEIGEQLRALAMENDCGVRFTGAGGGGCVWALGAMEDIDRLRGIWENILRQRRDARILDWHVDGRGVTVRVL